MGYSRYKDRNVKKIAKYLEINEDPIYTQLKNTNVNHILNNNFIIEFLEEKVNKGELSKITKDNLPYIFSYKKNELERKVKIQKMLNSFDIELTNNFSINMGEIEYKSVMYETGVIKKVTINAEPKLLDADLKKILTYCKEEGITHIYEIIEKRFGIDVNKVNLSMSSIFNIYNISNYDIKLGDNEYLTHLAYVTPENELCDECCEGECSDEDYDCERYYDIDVNKLKHSENSIKDCYIFNEVSYTVRGIKTFPKEVIDDFTMCKVDFEYFYNKYVKKKDSDAI